MKTRIQTSVERLQKHLVARSSKTSASAMMLIAAALTCFAVSPASLARPQPTATPTPTATPPLGEDRGNNNSAAENVDALNINTTGTVQHSTRLTRPVGEHNGYGNTANGSYALSSNMTGSINTAVGAYSLQNNTTGSKQRLAIARFGATPSVHGMWPWALLRSEITQLAGPTPPLAVTRSPPIPLA